MRRSAGQLQSVVVAVRSGGKLRHGPKPRVGRLQVRKRSKAAWADRLVAVFLGEIRLVQGASADVLGVQAGRTPELMLDPEAPLLEVGRAQLAAGRRRHRHGRKARRGICLRGRAGKLTAPRTLKLKA